MDYFSLLAKKHGFALEFYNCLSYQAEDFFNEGKINTFINIAPDIKDYEKHYYSDPIGTCNINLLVRDSYATQESFFGKILTNFKKTFVVEDRYKTFIEGVLTTLLITVFSIILGLALGFLVFILIRNTPEISNTIYKIVEFLISGTPAVVFLMICYYVIFAGTDIPSNIVSIIAFGLIFMCSTVSMLKTSFSSIDKGQSEAAFTLGYSKSRTFFKILLPQASKTFMPILKNNIVEHVKATAIVGYIAIIDLTKAGEIIRSRTFDAMFSLLVVTILYFLIEYVFIFILKLIPVDPKQRKTIKVLEGVTNND